MTIYVNKKENTFYRVPEDYDLNSFLIDDLKDDGVHFISWDWFTNEERAALFDYLETLPFKALAEITNQWNEQHRTKWWEPTRVSDNLLDFAGVDYISETDQETREEFVSDYGVNYFRPQFENDLDINDLTNVLEIAKKYDTNLSFNDICGYCQGEGVIVWTTNSDYDLNSGQEYNNIQEVVFSTWSRIEELESNGISEGFIDETVSSNEAEYMQKEYNAAPAEETVTGRVENGSYQVITEWK